MQRDHAFRIPRRSRATEQSPETAEGKAGNQAENEQYPCESKYVYHQVPDVVPRARHAFVECDGRRIANLGQ